MSNTPPGDTTKLIPPPRRGARYIDLLLAAIAGSLATVLVIALLFLGNQRIGILPSATSPSPSASTSPSASFSPARPRPRRARRSRARRHQRRGPSTPAPTPQPTKTP